MSPAQSSMTQHRTPSNGHSWNREEKLLPVHRQKNRAKVAQWQAQNQPGAYRASRWKNKTASSIFLSQHKRNANWRASSTLRGNTRSNPSVSIEVLFITARSRLCICPEVHWHWNGATGVFRGWEQVGLCQCHGNVSGGPKALSTASLTLG